jgi:hypothetical protein
MSDIASVFVVPAPLNPEGEEFRGKMGFNFRKQ